jgi:hypothetical protein
VGYQASPGFCPITGYVHLILRLLQVLLAVVVDLPKVGANTITLSCLFHLRHSIYHMRFVHIGSVKSVEIFDSSYLLQ